MSEETEKRLGIKSTLYWYYRLISPNVAATLPYVISVIVSLRFLYYWTCFATLDDGDNVISIPATYDSLVFAYIAYWYVRCVYSMLNYSPKYMLTRSRVLDLMLMFMPTVVASVMIWLACRSLLPGEFIVVACFGLIPINAFAGWAAAYDPSLTPFVNFKRCIGLTIRAYFSIHLHGVVVSFSFYFVLKFFSGTASLSIMLSNGVFWGAIFYLGIIYPILKMFLIKLYKMLLLTITSATYVVIDGLDAESHRDTLLSRERQFILGYETLFGLPGRVLVYQSANHVTFAVALILSTIVEAVPRLYQAHKTKSERRKQVEPAIMTDTQSAFQTYDQKEVDIDDELIQSAVTHELTPSAGTQRNEIIPRSVTVNFTVPEKHLSAATGQTTINSSTHALMSLNQHVSMLNSIVEKVDVQLVVSPSDAHAFSTLSLCLSDWVCRMAAIGYMFAFSSSNAPWMACFGNYTYTILSIRAIISIPIMIIIDAAAIGLETLWARLDLEKAVRVTEGLKVKFDVHVSIFCAVGSVILVGIGVQAWMYTSLTGAGPYCYHIGRK